MKWTKQTPTAPGWYWFRDAPDDKEPRVIGIEEFPPDGVLHAMGVDYGDDEPLAKLLLRYESRQVEWCGPIIPPGEELQTTITIPLACPYCKHALFNLPKFEDEPLQCVCTNPDCDLSSVRLLRPKVTLERFRG